MKEYKVKYWTGQRYPGGPAVFYYVIVAAPDEEEAGKVAEDYYVRRTGAANFRLQEVTPYAKPRGYVLDEVTS